MDRAQRFWLLCLGQRQSRPAENRAYYWPGSKRDLAGAAADQIGETVSFSGFHFTIVGQSKDEIVLTVS